jgi:putative Mg2+ transporter-C (MgtC) family protein
LLTTVCREADEINTRTALSDSMYSTPLSLQSPTTEDAEHAAGRIRVTAILKPHPKHRSKLERMASRLSVEKRASSVSSTAKEAEPTPE